MPWNSVGAPGNTVTRSSAPMATTRSTSQTGSGIMVATQQGHIVGVEEVSDRHQDPGPTPPKDVSGLGPLEPRVHRYERGAGLEQSQGGHDPLGAVEGPDCNAVARLDARGDESGPELSGAVNEFPVVEPLPVLDDRGPVTEPLCGRGDHPRYGDPLAGASGVGHLATVSSMFIRRARLPPMIFRTVSSGSPSSSLT